MGRKSKWADEIERLVDIGYEPKQIVKKTGLAISTVYKHVEKLRRHARFRFDNLMSKDYLYQYFKVLDNFAMTIQQCNEELDLTHQKYDVLEKQLNKAVDELDQSKHPIAHSAMLGQLIQIQNSRENAVVRLTAQRDKASDLKAKVYNAGPVVSAIDNWVRDNTPTMAELPELNMIEPNDKVEKSPEISEEDMKILREMDEN